MSSMPSILMPPPQSSSSLHAWLSLLLTNARPVSRQQRDKAPRDLASSFTLTEATGPERVEVERFIRQRYAEAFGSRIEAYMPRLFSLRASDGAIQGAFGLRCAQRPLFLERYLDQPIDQIIGHRLGRMTKREHVVEVGHFSGSHAGTVRTMICLLTERLYQEGYEWVTFTGTTHLRNAFARMGLAPIDIQAADPNRLTDDERAAWGRYYDHAPRVLAGNIVDGYHALASEAARLTGPRSTTA
jgi:hypothetical protein